MTRTIQQRLAASIAISLWLLVFGLSAHAAPPPKNLTLQVQGSGSVSLNPPGGAYTRGTMVTMTASPAADWQFDHWEGPTVDGSTANPQKITMYNHYTVTAVFTPAGGGAGLRQADAVIRVVDASGQGVDGVDVQIDMTEIDFAFGTAIAAWALDYPEYEAWIREHYNWAVAENASKWPQNEPAQGQVSYANADRIYTFATANGIRMRGHTVFWAVPDFVQQWVQDLPYPAGLQAAVDARLNDAVTHFAGKYQHWDVNNEMLHGSFFQDRLGSGIRPYMFNQVKAIDPTVQTFVNDYNIISGAYSLNDYITQIQGLLAAGAQIDGIGVQGHFSGGDTMAEITQRLDALAVFGLPIWVTEYDYADADPLARADYLEDFYRTAFGHPSVQGILMWGFWANAHWRGADAALLDADFTVNAAGQRYQALRAEWWTSSAGVSDGAGEVPFTGYYGDYTITLSDGVAVPETHDIAMPKGTAAPVFVLELGTGTPADVMPPQPDPPTWAQPPSGITRDVIRMAAMPATDENPVEYYFRNLGDAAHDSGWQSSPEYADAGLAADTTYAYEFTVRDTSIAQNTTGASAQISGTTLSDDGNVLQNEGFEYGSIEGWSANGSAAVTAQGDTVRSGAYAARASARSAAWDGIGQDLLEHAASGETWLCSAWMRVGGAASAPVGMTMRVTDQSGDTYHGLDWDTATDAGWVELSGAFTLSYTGTLSGLRLYFEGPDPAVDYLLDDVACLPDTGPLTDILVGDIAMSHSSKGPNNTAHADVLVRDENGVPISGASVNGSWSGTVSGNASGVTGANGRVTLDSPRSRNGGIYTFTVNSVALAGRSYNAALNIETTDSVSVP